MMLRLRTLKEGAIVEEIVEENFMNVETFCSLSDFLVFIFVYRRISQWMKKVARIMGI